MFPTEVIINWIMKILLMFLAALVTFLGFVIKSEKTKIDRHEQEIEKLKAQAVSEDKVREIVTESMCAAVVPIREDMTEIKELVKECSLTVKQLEIRVASQEGYQQAIKELKAVK